MPRSIFIDVPSNEWVDVEFKLLYDRGTLRNAPREVSLGMSLGHRGGRDRKGEIVADHARAEAFGADIHSFGSDRGAACEDMETR